MGVDFYCGDVTFGCSYGGWNQLRKFIIKSTFDYIQDKFQKDFEKYINIIIVIPDYKKINVFYSFYVCQNLEIIYFLHRHSQILLFSIFSSCAF